MGSETGTTQGPEIGYAYEGVVVRRCVSTVQATGKVGVALPSARDDDDGVIPNRVHVRTRGDESPCDPPIRTIPLGARARD